MRTQKGITLIALIITIVVLLILAVVAIGQAQETNIVGYAQNAATTYKENADEEKTILSNYETYIEGLDNPWRALGLKGTVYFDKLYSNTFTLDGETQHIEIIFYTNGKAYWINQEVSKEEVAEAVKEGYLKINSNKIESGEFKFEFTEDGKKINFYIQGNKIGELELKEDISSFKSFFAEKSRVYKGMLGSNIIYMEFKPDGTTRGVINGSAIIEGDNYKLVENEEIILSENYKYGPYNYVLSFKESDGTYSNDGYFSMDFQTYYIAQPTTYNGVVDGVMWIAYNLEDIKLEDVANKSE